MSVFRLSQNPIHSVLSEGGVARESLFRSLSRYRIPNPINAIPKPIATIPFHIGVGGIPSSGFSYDCDMKRPPATKAAMPETIKRRLNFMGSIAQF